MIELETSLHLYQPALYRGAKGSWKRSFANAVDDCGGRATWDLSAVLSILSFGYTCGDRTLVEEVRRRPWLSQIGPDNEPKLEKIPKHGRSWKPPAKIAEDLGSLLYNEALDVCKDRKEIYLPLSGGLDSRIVAGVLAKLYKDGNLSTKPVCVTWGLENSRDVVYGRMIAEILGSEWMHINMSHRDVAHNTEKMAIDVAALVSPAHLHCMHWFAGVSKDALVIAASYGDMVGRAEFSGKHVLELEYLRPINQFRLIKPEIYRRAVKDLQVDLKFLHERSPNEPKYVLCEHEMHGHYTRNMLSHLMSVINNYCRVYQMFTHPQVYSYMWSIHPALRDDRVYCALLEQLNPMLARIPWARTNRTLTGKKVGARPDLRRNFHEYALWISGPLFGRYNRYVDPEWFGETQLFDAVAIAGLTQEVRSMGEGKRALSFKPCEKWIWLIAFRRMAEYLEDEGIAVEFDKTSCSVRESVSYFVTDGKRNFARRTLSRLPFLFNLIRWSVKPFHEMRKKMRRARLKRGAVREYPPNIGV